MIFLSTYSLDLPRDAGIKVQWVAY